MCGIEIVSALPLPLPLLPLVSVCMSRQMGKQKSKEEKKMKWYKRTTRERKKNVCIGYFFPLSLSLCGGEWVSISHFSCVLIPFIIIPLSIRLPHELLLLYSLSLVVYEFSLFFSFWVQGVCLFHIRSVFFRASIMCRRAISLAWSPEKWQ